MTGAVLLDPLVPAVEGVYSDGRVVVERLDLGTRLDAGLRADGRIHVVHSIPVEELDDDLAEELANVLATVTGDHAVFCSAFTGVVATSDSDPLNAWERFYRQSLARLDDPARSGYVAVHRRAIELCIGDVLDLGCSLGLLALNLRRQGRRVIAVDPDRGTLRLVGRMSRRLAIPLDLAADTTALPAGCVDTVVALHVLEHVDAATGADLVAEALRLARRRIVIAVPYETWPTALFGHVRCVTRADLSELGAHTGWDARVADHHGGWLVLDRPHHRSQPGGSS